MTKFIIIGTGWRADFFYRIAKLLPETFEITAAVTRSMEKAELIRQETGVFATSSLEEALKREHDFVVLCVAKAAVFDYLKRLIQADEAVLCETPPAVCEEELGKLWHLSKNCHTRIQVCEQYLYQPLYGAWMNVINQGMIGTVSNMSLSALHDYHAVSIFRHFLNTGFESCTISGRIHKSLVTATGSRAGLDTDGRVISMERMLAVIEFDGGKTAFYDFSGEQYHSLIRTRRLNVQGDRGEINDMTIRCLNEKNLPITLDLNRVDAGVYNNTGWAHQCMMLGAETVYENPFPGARLNDDEIAVAACLRQMKLSFDGMEPAYSLRDALQDAYIGFKMKEACGNPGSAVRVEGMDWG